MSDSIDPTSTPSNNSPGDWALKNLVSLVNKVPISFGITLSIGGTVITGQLIGGKDYWNFFAEAFTAAWPGEDGAEGVRASFAKYGDIYSSDDASSDYQYIHLKEAMTYIGSQWVPSNGTLWRGRISEIAGYSLGSMTSSEGN